MGANELIQRVAERNLSLVERAGRVDVSDRDSADDAGRLLMEVKAQIKAIRDARMRVTRPLRAAIDEAIAQEEAVTTPLLEAEKHLKGLLLYWNEQEALRLEEERAELEQRQAELESASIRAMEERRMSDAAEAMNELAEFVPEEKPYRAAGTQVREVWKAEVTDLKSLVIAVANGLAPLDFLQPNMSALNNTARAWKAPSTFPGVRFTSEKSVAATGRV